jgi:hypothetical protein
MASRTSSARVSTIHYVNHSIVSHTTSHCHSSSSDLYCATLCLISMTDCTFCEKETAIFYCPECEDFYCTPCDTTAHSHKKRLTHVRTTLSLYSMEDAAFICTRAMRYLKCLKNLQRRVRIIIQRKFDKETLCHYYYNTLNHQTSWTKPSLLRQEELRPFLTTEEAAAIMQGMYHQYLGRKKANAEILLQYERLFDRHRMELYYAYVGASNLLIRQSWRQPRLMDRRGYHGYIRIVWTDDVAATVSVVFECIFYDIIHAHT